MVFDLRALIGGNDGEMAQASGTTIPPDMRRRACSVKFEYVLSELLYISEVISLGILGVQNSSFIDTIPCFGRDSRSPLCRVGTRDEQVIFS